MTRFTLTRKQRARLFDGELPRITGHGKCPVAKGHVHHLSSKVWLEVVTVIGIPDGWLLRYVLHDHRDTARLLRRTPPVHTEDADLQLATADVLNEASEESSYVSWGATAVGSAGEAVSPEAQERLTAQAKEDAAKHRAARRREQANLDTERRLAAYQREAAHRRIDISSEMRLVKKLTREGRGLDAPLLGVRRKLDSDLDRAA